MPSQQDQRQRVSTPAIAAQMGALHQYIQMNNSMRVPRVQNKGHIAKPFQNRKAIPESSTASTDEEAIKVKDESDSDIEVVDTDLATVKFPQAMRGLSLDHNQGDVDEHQHLPRPDVRHHPLHQTQTFHNHQAAIVRQRDQRGARNVHPNSASGPNGQLMTLQTFNVMRPKSLREALNHFVRPEIRHRALYESQRPHWKTHSEMELMHLLRCTDSEAKAVYLARRYFLNKAHKQEMARRRARQTVQANRPTQAEEPDEMEDVSSPAHASIEEPEARLEVQPEASSRDTVIRQVLLGAQLETQKLTDEVKLLHRILKKKNVDKLSIDEIKARVAGGQKRSEAIEAVLGT